MSAATGLVPDSSAATASRQHAVRLLWPNLPMLLSGSVIVAMVWSTIRLLVPGGGPVAVLAVGLVVVPVFAALLHGCRTLLTGDHFGITSLLGALPRTALPALKVSLVPTGALLLTSVSLEAWRVSGATWMLASVGVGGTISLLAGCAGVVALPYVVSTGVSLRQGWLVAWYVTTRSPVPVVAVAAAVVLAVWVSAHLSFALIMLLPAPVAVVWAAAVRQAIDRGASRLARQTSTTS